MQIRQNQQHGGYCCRRSDERCADDQQHEDPQWHDHPSLVNQHEQRADLRIFDDLLLDVPDRFSELQDKILRRYNAEIALRCFRGVFVLGRCSGCGCGSGVLRLAVRSGGAVALAAAACGGIVFIPLHFVSVMNSINPLGRDLNRILRRFRIHMLVMACCASGGGGFILRRGGGFYIRSIGRASCCLIAVVLLRSIVRL